MIKSFWLDYAISKYNKLKKNDTNPEIDVVMNTSFIQSLNINSILLLLLKIINIHLNDLKFMFLITLSLITINYILNKKYNILKKEVLKNRIPKYKNSIYSLYGLFSAIILFVLACIK